MYIRIRRKQPPTLSDAFVVLAWLAFVSCCACDIRLNQLGLFAPGQTYENSLTDINPDPSKSVEALKVYIILSDLILIVDHLWLGIAVLYEPLAHQSCSFNVLLRACSTHPEGSLDCSPDDHCVHRCYLHNGFRFERILLSTYIFQLVFLFLNLM